MTSCCLIYGNIQPKVAHIRVHNNLPKDTKSNPNPNPNPNPTITKHAKVTQ